MDYNKNAAQNVVLYLSHRELILILGRVNHVVIILYLSHRELIPG